MVQGGRRQKEDIKVPHQVEDKEKRKGTRYETNAPKKKRTAAEERKKREG